MYRIILFVILFSTSCRQANKPVVALQFNCDSLLDHQVQLLSKSKAGLKKIASVNESGSEQYFRDGAIQWEKELEPFKAISLINKPIYADAYFTTIQPDTKSNLMIKSWTAKDKASIKSLKVYYLNNQAVIKKVEATLVVNNLLFQSQKDLEIKFDVLSDSALPEGFKFSGYQKFLWSDPSYFSMEGVIQLK